jgi:glutamate synthase domain-containing protein 3
MTEKDLKELADAARARVEAMSPEDQAAHWEAQRSSFVRVMPRTKLLRARRT